MFYTSQAQKKMESKQKILQEPKTIFKSLKTDKKSVLFSEEKLNLKLFKKLKKSTYVNDKKLLKLINVAENTIEEFNKNDNKIPIRLDYVENRKIDRSTLYSFNVPFQFMHADIANLDFLGKSTAIPKYASSIVDLFLTKVYVYPMQLQKQLLKYINIFYVEIKNKGNVQQNMKVQTDNEFGQVKIKDLNDKYNVTIFTRNVHG